MDDELPFEDFDEFVERMDVKPDELGAAFAAWLARETDWDGDFRQVPS